jgi:hypothetical protein
MTGAPPTQDSKAKAFTTVDTKDTEGKPSKISVFSAFSGLRAFALGGSGYEQSAVRFKMERVAVPD